MDSNTEARHMHGVTRVLARALRASHPTNDDRALPDAQRAFGALELLDDMLSLLPASSDMAAFMADVYALVRQRDGNGENLRMSRLRETYCRIEQALNGVRNYYVTTDHARLMQADAVIREAYAVLADRSYVRVQRGDEVGFDVIASMLIGDYPSGRKFELAVTWDAQLLQWRMDGGAFDAGGPCARTEIDEVIGSRLDANAIPLVIGAAMRLIRLCSTSPIQLHRSAVQRITK